MFSVQYSVHDLIYNVTNYCVSSCDMGEISVYSW